MVSIRASLGLTAAILAMATVAACSQKPAGDATTSAPADTATTAKVAVDNLDTVDGVKFASLKGDAAAGEKAFAVCKMCHAVAEGKNMVGPSMHALIGRTSGTIPGYNYSTANKNSGIVWTEAKLFQYLETPQRIMPGTKMTYTGLKDPQKRADVVAYLKTQI